MQTCVYKVNIKTLNEGGRVSVVCKPGALLPVYATDGSAGADIHAYLPEKPVIIHPGEYVLIPTGLRMAVPSGFEIQVRPRSGLAVKYGLTVLNAPGTIDSDYRGEVKVVLINHGANPYTVNHGERIAQLVLARTVQASFFETDSLESTERGEGGFGSTGT